jgi:hypothetical protein
MLAQLNYNTAWCWTTQIEGLGYGLGDWRDRVRSSDRKKDSCFRHHTHTYSGAGTASCPESTGGCIPGSKTVRVCS